MANFLSDSSLFADKPSVGEYYLYFGRLSREKGVGTLVKAYAGLNTKRKLYIVGTGPKEEETKELIHKLHMEEKIKMLGFRSGDDLKSIVRNSLCVILPSEWYENGPYSIMEAMAAGKPAIVSSYGGLPELVEEGENGYICRSGDSADLGAKMAEIDSLSEEELLNMSKESIAMAKEKFGREEYYRAVMACYERILKQR
ncbi:MAG: glycosyltransferase family 4 protein [Eubacterium sp.]|nr:glycosyltransferase family 4 protein [Eubacterium sp.]